MLLLLFLLLLLSLLLLLLFTYWQRMVGVECCSEYPTIVMFHISPALASWGRANSRLEPFLCVVISYTSQSDGKV